VGRPFISEPDDSHDLAALRTRLHTARERLARLPVANDRHAGPTDPSTGEGWHRGNVLGHVNEMLPFWTDQIRRASEGSGKVGRDQEGATQRRQGIDQGNATTEGELRLSVDVGIERVLELMEALSSDDLERVVAYHSRAGDRDAQLGELLQLLIVGHLEDHLAQLASLG
jgi:hypothetical protein